ncbi:hypothetical protein CPB83DRAFT_849072 [Crepidotus variabilis]|uniref:Inactive metallocarboxypeptidase ECM14 n=1 Tax=Crepidotus variabilis TaxID=179855 RepID=A0A9P6ELW9_9AGAR|nr:hypothetical protein CPB83DRAFT_849072 [Crepidotus variabilis]
MATTYILSFLALTVANVVAAEQQVLPNVLGNGVVNRLESSDVPRVLALANRHDLDVWHASDSNVDIYLPPGGPSLPDELKKLTRTSWIVPAAQPEPLVRVSTEWNVSTVVNSTFHDNYHPIEEVKDFMKQLVAVYPSTTQLTNFGQTAEGRELLALTISSGVYNLQEVDEVEEEIVEEDFQGKKKKKTKHSRKKTRPPLRVTEKLGVVIIGAQHAREWIGSSTALYLAHTLSLHRNDSQSLSKLLDHFDFHFIPIPNPDGYDYTWKTDRYWYKNRQALGPHAKCLGLDMNRNWGYKWRSSVALAETSGNNSDIQSSETPNPCSQFYPGVRPFESSEVNDIANWITTLPNLAAFVELRSYGQMLSSPYSYSCKRLAKDAEDQIEAAIGASQALHSVHGTEFKVGSLCSTLYPAHGNMLDWMYKREGIKYSYVAHLRDTGTHGFTLPPKWIRPTGEETSRLVDYLSRFIAKQAKREF